MTDRLSSVYGCISRVFSVPSVATVSSPSELSRRRGRRRYNMTSCAHVVPGIRARELQRSLAERRSLRRISLMTFPCVLCVLCGKKMRIGSPA